MVSQQYYLKRFISSMPQRYLLIRELRESKSKLDEKVLSGQYLSQSEIEKLLLIVGRDGIFRKAENKNKPTLRHLSRKLSKSMKVLDDFQSELNPSKIDKKFRQKVLFFTKFLQERMPYVDDFIEKLDKVYRKETLALQQLLEDPRKIEGYKELLDREKEIFIQAEPYFSLFRERSMNLANFIREYSDYLKSESKNTPSEEFMQATGTAAFSLLVLYVALGQVIYLFHPHEYIVPPDFWSIALTSGMAIWMSIRIKDYIIKIRNAMETLI